MGARELITVEPGTNVHACAIEIGGTGVLITGASGSGKTSLAHGLIDYSSGRSAKAIWVGDDQLFLNENNGRIIAKAPDSIAGKAELYGHGIIEVEHKPQTAIGLLAVLVPDEQIERMPEDEFCVFAIGPIEIQIPMIKLPIRHEAQAIRLLTAKLLEMNNRLQAHP